MKRLAAGTIASLIVVLGALVGSGNRLTYASTVRVRKVQHDPKQYKARSGRLLLQHMGGIMKHRSIRGSLSVILLCLAVIPNHQTTSAATLSANSPFRCPGAPFFFPVDTGVIGWLYRDPASIGTDPSGLHSGIDVFAGGGSGSPIYALADGVESVS